MDDKNSSAQLYRKTALVKAEQFLPGEGKIPQGVISDGHGDPRKDPRYSFILKTKEGTHYLRNGDYVCTGVEGEQWNVERTIFESTYELATQPTEPAQGVGLTERDIRGLCWDVARAGNYPDLCTKVPADEVAQFSVDLASAILARQTAPTAEWAAVPEGLMMRARTIVPRLYNNPPNVSDAVEAGDVIQYFIGHAVAAASSSAAPVAQEGESRRSLILGHAVTHHNLKWPESLWTGVMFFNGERITKGEFEERAAIAAKGRQS